MSFGAYFLDAYSIFIGTDIWRYYFQLSVSCHDYLMIIYAPPLLY